MGMETPGKVLIMDDDRMWRADLSEILEGERYEVVTVATTSQLNQALDSDGFDCFLLDVKMPGISGDKLLLQLIERFPLTPVIMISGESDYETVVRCIRAGAYDFIQKPFQETDLLRVIENALELRNARKAVIIQSGLIGESAAMKAVYRAIDRYGAVDETVLIRGESGTGKELVARALCRASHRAEQSFVGVNCAAIGTDMAESEFFGHRKGAFTGALEARPGKFKSADKGTIFLDEIADMAIDLQSKVLRAIEYGEIQPVGKDLPEKVDVRILSATHRNLEALVGDGGFREDLLRRLQVIEIYIPPLRERRDDIPLLVQNFLARINMEHRKYAAISNEAIARLQDHDWPGNVRGLLHTMKRLVINNDSGVISGTEVYHELSLKPSSRLSRLPFTAGPTLALDQAINQFEKQYLEAVLNRCDWDRNATAEALGVNRTTLWRKMEIHRLRK